MIWLTLAALIGSFYYQKKHHTSFWVGYLFAGSLYFGIYFGLSAVAAFFTSVFGLEDFSPTFYYGLLFTVLTIGCVRVRKSLRVSINQTLQDANLSKRTSKQGDSPKNISGFNQILSGATIQTSLAGVTFENRQVLLKSVVEGEPVKLVREPNNIHDHNAIRVRLFKDRFGRNDLGYINKEMAKQIAPLLDKANKPFIEGVISSIYSPRNDPSITGAKVSFSIPNEQKDALEVIEESSHTDQDTMIKNLVLLTKTNNEFDHLNQKKKSISLDFDPNLITDVPFEETQALVSLFFSTEGNRWNNSTNWLTDSQVGLWEGIKVQNGHVIGLSLSSNGLRGVIPSEIRYLKELQYLLLYDNQLIGTIPPELGSLVSLEHLYLYQNQLTGSLPPQMGGLVNLKELDIGNNNLNGFFPLTFINLSQLEYLNYIETNITEPDDIRFQDWKDTVESWEGGVSFNQEND